MLDIINLTNGVEVTYQMCLVRCLCSPICPGISASVTHSAGGTVSTCSYSVGDDGFTALVVLLPGVNHIVAQYGTHVATRQVVYTPPLQDKFVRLIYVTSFDEEKFQGPAGMDRSANAAVRRIQTGVLALQTFMAESLHEEGLERKTFKLELTPKGLPKVHVLQLPLPLHEVHRQREERLWEVVAMQVLSSPHLANPHCKYLAFLGATRYCNTEGAQVSSEATVVSLTKGHVSLGGGGLALVGTGALYSWPEVPSQLLAAFADTSRVDTTALMDFSGGRGTWGACFGTHLGSVLHELGHTFDLGHTKHGIMARGFEDLHIFFTAPLLHCSFAKHNARGNIRASLSSSSLVKEPVTFRTDFVARQQQPSNINMTVAPLDSETTSSDTSSSDAFDPDSSTECSSSQALPSLAYKCSLHGYADQKLSTPPISTSSALSSSDASTPDDSRRLTGSPGIPVSASNNLHSADSGVSANDNTAYSGKLTSSFSNLTTSLYDLDSGDSKHDSDTSPAKVMTTSFTNLTCNDSGALPGSRPPQSLSSMPDLSEGGFGKKNAGRWSSPGWRGHRASSVSCRAFWARANAVMLHSHKWLNDFADGPKPQLKGSVIMAGPGLRLVELRDLNTLMFHHWEWVGRKAPPVLHVPWASVPKWPHDKQVHLLALDAEGNLLKDCLVNKPL